MSLSTPTLAILRSAGLTGALALILSTTGLTAQGAPFTRIADGVVVTDAADSLALAWGDLDGDSNLDLFFASGSGEDNQLYLGAGDGTFTSVTTGSLVNEHANSSDVLLADVDDDGDLDVFVTQRFAASNSLFLNLGFAQGGTEGTFVKDFASATVTNVGNSEGACFDDFDGDGDLDLVVVNAGVEDNFLFRNDAAGFTRITVGPVANDAGNSLDCASGDFDGDGDRDMFVCNGAENNMMYVNGGTGAFAKGSALAVSQHGGDSRAAFFADVDGDGDEDLLVANNLEDNFVYRNGGGAQGGTEGAYDRLMTHVMAVDGLRASRGIAAADVDGDGDLDFALCNCCSQDNDMYENQGDFDMMRVTIGPAVNDGGYSSSLGFADTDGDGDVELAVANSTSGAGNGNFLYRNDTTLGPNGGFVDLGFEKAGTFGFPELGGVGTWADAEVLTMWTTNTLPATTTFLVYGATQINASFKQGTLVPDPTFVLPIPTDATGTWALDAGVPVGILPPGLTLYFQVWIPDGVAIANFSATNALSGTTPL